MEYRCYICSEKIAAREVFLFFVDKLLYSRIMITTKTYKNILLEALESLFRIGKETMIKVFQ